MLNFIAFSSRIYLYLANHVFIVFRFELFYILCIEVSVLFIVNSFPADAVTAGKFPCQKCDRVFNEVRQLRGHQSIHSSRQTFMGTKRRKLSKTQKNSTENKSDPDACLVKEEGSNRSASLGVDGEGMRVQAERSRGTRSVLCSASKAAGKS